MFAILRSVASTLSLPRSLPKPLQTPHNGEASTAIRNVTVLRRVKAASAVQIERFRNLDRPGALVSYDLGLPAVLEAELSVLDLA